MKAHESECVAMKRRGAKYVSKLLSGKSRKEQLEFWIKRTENLLDQKSNHTILAHNKSLKTDRANIALNKSS